MWQDNRMQPRDWLWLRKIEDVANNREQSLPEVGRYNAGQKLLFFTIVACLTGLLLSGIVIGVVCALIAIAPAFFERGGHLPDPSLALLLLAVPLTGMLASLAAVRAVGKAPVLETLRSE